MEQGQRKEKVSYYRMAIIAMLFGTGELILSSKMNSEPQLIMFVMVFMSYLVAFTCYRMHVVDQYNYIHKLDKYA